MGKISSILLLNLKSSLFRLRRRHHHHLLPPLTIPFQTSTKSIFSRLFTTQNRNTKVNFSLSDSESDDDTKLTTTPAVKEKLPPPYDPFNKIPVIKEPDDPKNLQQVFYNIRTQGLNNSAVKMFDALSKDGLTHEALQLFSQIKDKGHMPDVVAHTAVIEAYAAAGKPKEAFKVYMRMLASGVLPNAYTYTVLIKSLAGSGDHKLLGEAKKCFVEMMEKNIRPNAGTCVAFFEGIVKGGKEDEGRQLVMKMKSFGFAPDEKSVTEILNNKTGPVFPSVIINILFEN